MVRTGLRPFSPGVRASELRDLVSSFGSSSAVLVFEATTGKSCYVKREQATDSRRYIKDVVRSSDVFAGIVYVHRPEACWKSLDLIMDVSEYNARRYSMAVNLSVDFRRSDGSGRTLLVDHERRVVERILQEHEKTGIPLEDFLDSYRAGGAWDKVGKLFPEYSNGELFDKHTGGVRGVAQELYIAITLAAHTRYGAIVVRQPYEFEHPRHGHVASDIDVALITSREAADASLASLKREPGLRLIIRDLALHDRVEHAPQTPDIPLHYQRAA